MKSFAIDKKSGDLIIENNEIQMAENEELTRQKVQTVIGTNKGEWFLDWEQGIDFSNILGKGITDEMVQAEIESGLRQVDETLHISEFSRNVKERHSETVFTAIAEDSDTEIEVIKEWQ